MEEAVEYLGKALRAHEKILPMRPVYAITGSGNHSRGGKDKLSKAVRNFLNDWHYVYREFAGPGDRNGMGGVVGIDPTSWDRALESASSDGSSAGLGGSFHERSLSGSSLSGLNDFSGQALSSKLVILKREG